MSLPPVNIPVRVDKEGALLAIRETEAAHQASISRMDATQRAAWARSKAAAADLGRQMRQASSDPLMGSSPALYTAETTRAATATRELERSTVAVDRTMQRTFRAGARGMAALGAGIGAATAAAAGSERSFVALGTSILSSFAAGGPIAGGLAIVAGAIGWMVGQTKEAEEAAKKADAAHAAWLDGVKERAEDASKAARDLARDLAAAQFKRVGIDIDPKQQELMARGRELEDTLGDRRRALAGVDVPDADLVRGAVAAAGGPRGDWQSIYKARKQALADLRAEIAALEKESRSVRAQLDAIGILKGDALEQDVQGKATDDAAAKGKLVDAARRELEVLKERTPLERELRQLVQERQAAVLSGIPRETAQATFLLKVEEARRQEASRYTAELAERATKEEQAQRALEGWLDDEIEAREKLVKSSADMLRHLEQNLATEQATEGVERDRVEAEIQIAEAIAAGTLAAKDQEKALALLLNLAKERRANAAEKDAAAKAKREQEEATRKAEQIADRRADATADVEKQLRLLSASNDVERQILEIEERIAEYRKAGVPEGLLGELKGKLVAQVLEGAKGANAIQEFVSSITPTLSGGLAEVIVDGIRTGFDDAGEIAEQLWDQLLRQLANQLVSSALNGLITSIFSGIGGGGASAAGGGGFIGMALGAITGSLSGAPSGGGVVESIAAGAAGCGGGG